MSEMFLSGFMFILTHILLDLISLGTAEAYSGWGGKLSIDNVWNVSVRFYVYFNTYFSWSDFSRYCRSIQWV